MLDRLAKKIVDALIIPASRRKRFALGDTTVVGAMQRQSVEESAEYARRNMVTAMLFERTNDFRAHAFSKRKPQGLILEFGVFQGLGVNLFASLTTDPVHGFDSFEGLQEDWGGSLGAVKGFFDVKGVLPKVRSNVTLHKGWFNETLPGFLAAHPEEVSFVNFDADTYESTKYLLDALADRIRPGAILLFDEYFGFRGWREGEYRAWQEYVAERGVKFTYLAICEGRIAVRVDA